MSQVADYIKRAAERTKYRRVSFVENDMPTNPSLVRAIPFYGDLESTLILSSLLLRSYIENNRNHYFILCSWPGFEGLFPYVDEYWTLDDESVTKTLALGANNFYNAAGLSTELARGVMECMGVITHKDWKDWWDRGFTDNYWNTIGKVKRYLPEIPSSNKISESFVKQLSQKRGRKILVYPVAKVQSWQRGKSVYLPISKEFWSVLIERLLAEGYSPVIYQNWFTYDMSRDFTDRCVYLVAQKITDILTAMNYIGLVLDVFSGISKLAVAARTPFIAATERQKHFEYKDNAVFDLCSQEQGQFIFSFSTMLMTGGEKEWKSSLIDQVISRLDGFDSESTASTAESYEEVSYNNVRDRKAKRMGVTFINSSKNQ